MLAYWAPLHTAVQLVQGRASSPHWKQAAPRAHLASPQHAPRQCICAAEGTARSLGPPAPALATAPALAPAPAPAAVSGARALEAVFKVTLCTPLSRYHGEISWPLPLRFFRAELPAPVYSITCQSSANFIQQPWCCPRSTPHDIPGTCTAARCRHDPRHLHWYALCSCSLLVVCPPLVPSHACQSIRTTGSRACFA